MICDTWRAIGFIFHGVCIVATCSVIAYWMYMFTLNEDTSLVEYRHYYEEKDDVFPALSLCFRNPFSIRRLDIALDGLNHTSYFKFLNGEDSNPEMSAIDYDSITMNISSNIINSWIAFHDGSSQYYDFSDSSKSRLVHSFAGFWDKRFYGCYRLQIPDDKNIWYYSLHLKNNIFPFGQRPPHYDFFTLIHYPNQLLTSLGSIRYHWSERLTNNTYVMRFKVDKVEVIRRRNKAAHPCHEGWKNYDDDLLVEYVERIGCRAPYQKHRTEVRLCSTKSEMQKSRFTLRTDLNGMLNPCKTLQKVIYDYSESDLSTTDDAGKNSIWVGLMLLDPYFMEITQTRYNKLHFKTYIN